MSVKIIILNGVGSAGKGSIARKLQTILAEPFLHLQMDTFMNMQPERYDNHPEVDTSHTSPADCAALIKRKLRL